MGADGNSASLRILKDRKLIKAVSIENFPLGPKDTISEKELRRVFELPPKK